MAVSIRPGRAEDSETLFAIHRESAVVAYAHVFPPERYRFPEEEMRAHGEAAVREPEVTVLVAELEARAAGFATFSPGWLRNLFVLPAAWGRGVGGALHDAGVAELRAQSDKALLWVLEENARARRFYEARGWRPDGGRTRSRFPPFPVELRYALELTRAAPGRTHP
ncbi:MAG TPA: GNAT family N-acetyltransferase [Gaiellaceae bacterium]|nr:GNAT family N-acetyltransferase [Gaiellaceae bacterium]